MEESRCAFKAQLKRCQNNQEKLKMDILASHHAKNNYKSWKCTKRLNPRISVPIGVNGVTKPRDIAKLFKDHFHVEPTPQTCVLCCGRLKKKQQKKQLLLKDLWVGEDLRYTMDLVLSICSVLVLIYLGFILCYLFTFCVRHKYIPVECIKTVVVPIVKNKNGPTNYGPISMATTIVKVLDGLLDRVICC